MNFIFLNIIVNIKRQLQKYINSKFQEQNLKSSEIFLIEFLYKFGNKTQIELSHIMECNKSHIHRIVNKLITKNLIEYTENYCDCSKKQILTLSENGKKLGFEINDTINKWHDTLFQNISKEELDITENVLNTLLNTANKLNMENKK